MIRITIDAFIKEALTIYYGDVWASKVYNNIVYSFSNYSDIISSFYDFKYYNLTQCVYTVSNIILR